ncbi:C-type lectin domain family 4 member M-like isoform X2 [Myxocyprinus asiaticus]|uniref:C-type lectin domain family 4 member M-like isoform X2 n=1 Tax=Myxocyprinus asiaticus TaxID=70543 RepID=UPI002222BAFB|nr:C-type lectin domain family 4 member M-like isoform X2 [Myxocyprinus asiaticus]
MSEDIYNNVIRAESLGMELMVDIYELADSVIDHDFRTETDFNINTHQQLQYPDGWIYYQLSFYYLSSELKSWNESRRYCTERGADLVIINNREEQDFVRKISKGESVWIGLSDSDEEGTWKWVDSIKLTSGFWSAGEPNDHKGNEDCVITGSWLFSSGWADYPCNNAFKWACEKSILK